GLENRSRVDANSSASTLACSLAITVPFPLCTRLFGRLDAQAPHQRMCLIQVPVAAPRATQLGPTPVVPGHLLTNHIGSGTNDVEVARQGAVPRSPGSGRKKKLYRRRWPPLILSPRTRLIPSGRRPRSG